MVCGSKKWTLGVSIPLPPACEAGALPFELNALDVYYTHTKTITIKTQTQQTHTTHKQTLQILQTQTLHIIPQRIHTMYHAHHTSPHSASAPSTTYTFIHVHIRTHMHTCIYTCGYWMNCRVTNQESRVKSQESRPKLVRLRNEVARIWQDAIRGNECARSGR